MLVGVPGARYSLVKGERIVRSVLGTRLRHSTIISWVYVGDWSDDPYH
jgi:hypothetical protein